MKLLNRLVIKNLKLNKKRTIATIIGIILATFLLTGVVTIVCSFQKSLLNYNKKVNGDYHYEFINIPFSDKDTIINNDNIEEYFYTQVVGKYSLNKILDRNSSIELLGVTEKDINKLGISLQEGRMPKNNNEIVISSKLKKYQSQNLKIGNKIILNCNEKNNEYTIVGTINITNTYIEPKENNNQDINKFTAITCLTDKDFNTNNINIYVGLKDLNTRIETIAEIVGVDADTLEKLTVPNKITTEINLQENKSNKYFYFCNNTLISMETGEYVDETAKMIYTVAGIIIIIIILTSTYCIRNSFDISITEKIKQYGILSSVGATKKQIRKIVFYEAFVLGIIAIPIGVITGLLFIYYFFKIAETYISEKIFKIDFIFSTNITAIIFIVIFSCLVLYFSAKKSAKKAAKISPIEAIKNNKDSIIKEKDLKIPNSTKKIFGMGGVISYKNIKRNKKKYRTTVVSIIIGVALLITGISFMKYALNVTETYLENENYDIFIVSNNYSDLYKIAQDSIINQNRYEICRTDFIDIIDKDEHYTEDVKAINSDDIIISIISLGEKEYERYLNELGLKYEQAKDKAILVDSTMQLIKDNEKTTHKIIDVFNYKEGDKISFFYNNKLRDLEIIKSIDKLPMVLPNGPKAYFIISDELMDKIGDIYFQPSIYIQSNNNDEELEKYIQENYSDCYWSLSNTAESRREQQAILTTISIFLYSFIIVTAFIGTTNIFNTITTSMELRQKEFAHLKSIGMTKKEFNKMIKLESIFLGIKSLIIGIPLGILFSYLTYLAFSINIELKYVFPIDGVIISIVAVSILIGSIMRYSLNKINKKNIIEILRNDNI